jgi:hypothetical protein
MFDPRAAITEFRSLDEKRKSRALSATEERRWSELRQVLADTAESVQGYYAADGQWYASDPQAEVTQEYPGWIWDPDQQQWVQQPGWETQDPSAQPASGRDASDQALWSPQNPSEQAAWSPQDPNEQAAWDPQDPNAQLGWEQDDPPTQGTAQPLTPTWESPADESISLADELNIPAVADASPPYEADEPEVMEVSSDDVVSLGYDAADTGAMFDESSGPDDPTIVELAERIGEVEAAPPAPDPYSVPEEEIPFAADTEVLDAADEQPILEALPEEQVIEPTPEEILDPSPEAAAEAFPPLPEILAMDVLELEENHSEEEHEAELPLTDIVSDAMPVAAVPAGRPSTLPAPTAVGGLNPSWVDGEHRVVVHTIEGQVKRGVIRDTDLLHDAISLDPLSGAAPERIPTERVKAIFFMLSTGSTSAQPSGRKIRIIFHDGRQVTGFADDFSSQDPGFFLTPEENSAHAQRIFIYRSSVRSVAEA